MVVGWWLKVMLLLLPFRKVVVVVAISVAYR
jgi:hypothetical protein